MRRRYLSTVLRLFPVMLAPYDTGWPAEAAAHIARLHAAVLGLLAIYHIGSTAVPGLSAKPVIDLMPVTPTLDAIDAATPAIVALGYTAHGAYGIEGRRYFVLAAPDGTRLAQAHAFAAGSPHVTRHLAFRDHLRANPRERDAYAAEKARAAALHPNDSHAYTDEKSAWIKAAEPRALAWANRQATP